MATTGEGSGLQDSQLFKELESYPWDSDEEFQAGLVGILGPNPVPDQVESLTLHARCFYYSRKFNVPVDFTAYQQWHYLHGSKKEATIEGDSTTTSQPSVTGEDPEAKPPYPMTFNHIVELITTGQPVPGIKEIPDTVLEGMSSESTTVRRKKPWEKSTEKPQVSAPG